MHSIGIPHSKRCWNGGGHTLRKNPRQGDVEDWGLGGVGRGGVGGKSIV